MPSPANIRRITIYTKSDCPLCDEAEHIVRTCSKPYNTVIERIDISSDSSLTEAYGHTIPVVAIDGTPLFYGKVSAFRFTKILAGEGISGRYRAFLRHLPSLFRSFVP